ncbi:MAG: hypothetical protein Q9185_003806 [Variospora sp. 1 TL-2023]
MPSKTIALLAAALALLSATNAHMIMNTPSPYGPGAIDSSPLDPSGSDFPCKQRSGVYDPPVSKNTMAIGAANTLSFNGSAVHGGGSCQISLTKDLKPTKSSKWMVIHSIEGGCPSKADGNLPADPEGTGAASFSYKIPQSINQGEYTLAWTWFNRIGNREMYMNCAPITVTGGGSKRRELDADEFLNATDTYSSDEIFKRDTSLPNMFEANMGNGCVSAAEGKDTKFPQPGESVERAGVAARLAPPTGSCSGGSSSAGAASGSDSTGASSAAASGSDSAGASSAAGPMEGSGSGSGSTGTPPTSPIVSVSAIPPTPTMDPAMNMSTAASSVMSAAPSAGTQAAAPAAAAASSGSSSGSGSPPSSGSASSEGSAGMPGSMPCSTAGAVICSADGMKFGVCQGGMAMMQAVAQGTSCKAGKIDFAKRSAKFARINRA